MASISRGFRGRRRDDLDPSRIPPGQHYERGFPVLSAGPTPRTPLEEWTFSIEGAVDQAQPRRPLEGAAVLERLTPDEPRRAPICRHVATVHDARAESLRA